MPTRSCTICSSSFASRSPIPRPARSRSIGSGGRVAADGIGGWVEDWSALSLKQRENFLFQITTRMFAWEMAAADAWGESMYARACWEEAFSVAYDAPSVGTIDDRRLGVASVAPMSAFSAS